MIEHSTSWSMCLIILCFLFGKVATKAANECSWKDDASFTYELSSLDRPDGWQLKDDESGMGMFSMVYVFNFCDFSKVKCHDRQVGVYEALAVMGQITENCDVVGSYETKMVQHIDAQDPKRGIRVTFSLGDLCLDIEQPEIKGPNKPETGGAMQPRQAIFDVECPANGRDDDDFTVIPGNDCVDHFRIRRKLACRGGSDGESFLFWLIKWSTIIFILYMGAMYYMNKRRGIEGPEAIPHLEFWQQLGNYLRIQLSQLFLKLKQFIGRLRGQGGYNTV